MLEFLPASFSSFWQQNRSTAFRRSVTQQIGRPPGTPEGHQTDGIEKMEETQELAVFGLPQVPDVAGGPGSDVVGIGTQVGRGGGRVVGDLVASALC